MNKINKNQKGFTAVEGLLIVLILVVIGAVGYMVYHNNHKSKPVSASTTAGKASNPKKATTKTQPPDPTANWATYTSSAGGFSFKYPATGWTLSGERDPGVTDVSGSQLNGSEYEVTLKEDPGQGLSTNGNKYYIFMALGGTGSINGLDNYTNAKSNPSYYQQLYNAGTVSSLSNGTQLWTANNNGGANCNNGATLQLVSGGNFYTSLSNGQLMEWQASFCYGYRATTTLSYAQQISSSETTVAKEVLASYKFQ